MLKFLLALMMLFVVGCAANKSPATSKSVNTATPFTAAEIGDDSPLDEVAAVDDEAVENLPDMVPAES